MQNQADAESYPTLRTAPDVNAPRRTWLRGFGACPTAEHGTIREIFLAHSMVELDQMARGIGLGVWSAIATFHGIASA
jgi:hypothetical protein